MEATQQPAAVTEPVTSPEPTPETPEPATPATETSQQSKMMMMPHSAVAEIRTKERERGKKIAFDELNEKAKTLGFDSYEEMENAALMAKQKAAAKATAEVSPETSPVSAEISAKPSSSDSREEKRLAKEHAEMLDKQRETNRRLAAEEKKRKAAERERDNVQVLAALERAAYTAGIKDTDYAVTLLKRATAGKSPEELLTFDEHTFFKGLRNSHPILFGVVSEPAHTAPDTSESAPGVVAASQVGKGSSHGPIDARKLSAQDYQELLRSRKIAKTNLFTGR